MNVTNENIEKAIQAITHDHCADCDNWQDCIDNYETYECLYHIAIKGLIILLSAREHAEEESEGNA